MESFPKIKIMRNNLYTVVEAIDSNDVIQKQDDIKHEVFPNDLNKMIMQ